MEVKKIDDTQITNAIDLIWQTFLQFEAPDYSEEGVKSFQEFIENKEIVKTLWCGIKKVDSLFSRIS